MIRGILPGSGNRFYSPENFPIFLESSFLEGAEIVCREFSIKDNENEGTARIYHIMPQNVTLVYSSINRVTMFEPKRNYQEVSIHLSGEEEKVDQLVKIIHDAERSFIK